MRLFVIVMMMFAVSPEVFAAEFSSGSALYSSEKYKTDGTNAGSRSTIDFTGRYADFYEGQMDFIAQGGVILNSYDAPSGGKAPSNSTSIILGGGLRLNFDSIGERVRPYALAVGSYKNVKTANITGAGYTETETSGLYYGASVGLRLVLDQYFFVDLESELFESALMGVVKTENNTGTGETETTSTDLHVDGRGNLNEVKIRFGMYL